MKNWELTEGSFDLFLSWLDPQHREAAGQKYEEIRHRLIVLFNSRGCIDPEELADETINRVIKRLPDMVDNYSGDPVPYFYTVARNLYLEHIKKPLVPLVDGHPQHINPLADETDDLERIHECLSKCLEKATPRTRELVINYYSEEKQAKISFRKEIAEQMGLTPSALRLKMHRIRESLQKCITQCLDE